jgi:hypothetical protein
MSIMEGTAELKSWRGFYDFAVDGGAVSTIALRSEDGQLPNGAVVMGGYAKVITPLTSGGAGTGALQVEAANDTINQAAVSGAPWSTAGRKSVIPVFTGASSLETTAARSPSLVIGTAALTAGKFDVILFYR